MTGSSTKPHLMNRLGRATDLRSYSALLCAFWAGLLVFETGAANLQRRVLPRHVPTAVANLAAVENLAANSTLDLTLGLPLRNESALTNLLGQLYDPSSSLYHHYLTSHEFTDQFGPTPEDYENLARFSEAHGLKVIDRQANRLVLEVRGTVSDVEKAFATKLKLYRHPRERRQFFAPEIEPSIEVGVPLLDIAGLDNFALPKPASLRPAQPLDRVVPNAGSASGGAYRGKDFRNAYLPGVALMGTGQSVGLLEFDGYYPSDITNYESEAALPNVPLQNILVNGATGNAGANNAEVALDIEVAIAIAPGLSSVLVYEGTSVNSILSRMASDNRAKQLSSSWTYTINATSENIFRQFASQGQSMFQASGDSGAYSGVIPPPADDPNLIVVGGTTLSTSGSAYESETAWNWASRGLGTGASGGGVSASYAIPSYQKGLNMTANQGSTILRNIPDVAFTADNIWVVWNNGSKGAFGGTSASTPLWAGFMALVNQQAVSNGRATMGFCNPALYAIGKGSNYATCFHDVTTGNNTNSSSASKFLAVTGYDLCTGWGTPAGQALINALAGGTNLPPVFSQNPLTVPTANTGQAYSGSISNLATDPNPAELLTFAKLSGPAWLDVASDGSLSGTPTSGNAGNNVFVVTVSESAGMSNSATMYLNVNGAPSFTSDPLTRLSANVGQAYSGTIASKAADPNPGDRLSFAKVSGPAWLVVSTVGGLSGTPENGDTGTNTFTVSVTDPGGLAGTATLYVEVNGPPSFSANPILTPAVMVGQSYSVTITNSAIDPNAGSTLTFSKVSGPAWLNVAADGTLSGTPAPTDAGTNSFSVMVRDPGGLSSSALVLIPVVSSSDFSLQITLQGSTLSLDWAGGNPPFQVQLSTNLSQRTWQNVGGPVTNRSLRMAPDGPSVLYRIQAGSL